LIIDYSLLIIRYLSQNQHHSLAFHILLSDSDGNSYQNQHDVSVFHYVRNFSHVSKNQHHASAW